MQNYTLPLQAEPGRTSLQAERSMCQTRKLANMGICNTVKSCDVPSLARSAAPIHFLRRLKLRSRPLLNYNFAYLLQPSRPSPQLPKGRGRLQGL